MFQLHAAPLSRIAAVLSVTLLSACSIWPEMPTFGILPSSEAPPETAIAQVNPTQGNEVTGQVKFTRHENDTLVEVSLTHLSPVPHGFHVHEKGDCSAPDGLSAGGHFNPDGLPHGGLDGPHHIGDLGNVVAGNDGTVNLNVHVKGLRLSGDQGIIGRAVIVHASADDLKTQPTGGSGKRVACGMIVHS